MPNMSCVRVLGGCVEFTARENQRKRPATVYYIIESLVAAIAVVLWFGLLFCLVVVSFYAKISNWHRVGTLVENPYVQT